MTQLISNIIPFPISPHLRTMKVPTASERVAETVAIASIGEHTVTAKDRAGCGRCLRSQRKLLGDRPCRGRRRGCCGR